ncbi:MAG TPA: adenylate/guanylate cyclase domain-containing protein, partial [Anaerolineales bacterium]
MKKLQAAREKGGMVGERRVVTMLFCDLKGSTAAAEGLDPEDWTEIMNGAFAQMIKPVYQYEGTIARLMGDALLAFFGAPIAHEDDPRRAILAGLDIVEAIKPYREQIRERYGVDFDVRVGINTGLVVVGAVGSDLRMEYSALGDAINLAARMEQTAEPGTVRIAHDTYKLVKNLFEFKSLGGVEIKGKSEPVLAYQALGRKFELGRTRGIEGLHAAMVGRDAELSALRNVMADLKQGLGRIIFVLGEAGLGKTRLISEAHEVFQTLGHTQAIWVETISLSYETNQAYGLFQRLIRRVGGIEYNDAPV